MSPGNLYVPMSRGRWITPAHLRAGAHLSLEAADALSFFDKERRPLAPDL
jgi:hypothetical protein